MKPRLSPRLVMAPLACGLSLAAMTPIFAAPSKKAAPPPAPVAEQAPPAKKPFFQKLNPFRKKDPAPAPAPAAPSQAPVKNSKKSAAPPPSAPVPPPATESIKPPVKNLTTAKTLKPSPSAVPSPAPGLAPTTAAAETAGETPKKTGFFSRLKAKLNADPDALPSGDKPPRPDDWKERWVVTEDSTAFFEFGPSQASGPDLRLARGQVVKLAQASRGWAKVELEGGRQGYIGTDQMRQAAETDFMEPLLPPGSQIAAAGGVPPKGWSPAAPMPDLPDLPMSPGMENSLLLLPPLEFEGTELKKGSMKLPRDASGTPTLNPGDALPPSAAPEPPSLESKSKSTADPESRTKPAPPSAPEPSPTPGPPPSAEATSPLPAPSEPVTPAPSVEPGSKIADPAPAPAAPAPAPAEPDPAPPATPAAGPAQ